jgi:hypothetical protein
VLVFLLCEIKGEKKEKGSYQRRKKKDDSKYIYTLRCVCVIRHGSKNKMEEEPREDRQPPGIF